MRHACPQCPRDPAGLLERLGCITSAYVQPDCARCTVQEKFMQVPENCQTANNPCAAPPAARASEASVLVVEPGVDTFDSKLEVDTASQKQWRCCLQVPRLPLPSVRQIGQGVAVVAGALGGGFIGGLIGLWCGGMGGGLVQVMSGSDADIASPALVWGARLGAGLGSLVGGAMVVGQIGARHPPYWF